MNKRISEICLLVCQAIAILLLFMPMMFYWEHWETIPMGYALSYRGDINFFGVLANTSSIVGIIALLLMCACLALMIIKIFKPDKEISSKIFIILTIGCLLFMLAFDYKVSIKDSYGYCVSNNWLFYVEVFFICATVLLSFVINSKLVKENESEASVIQKGNSQEFSAPQLLKQYKDLLDQNIITEEEFENKKKELLKQL